MAGNLGVGDFRVLVYEPRLDELMLPGEPPSVFADRVQNMTYTYAQRTAPVSGLKQPWGGHPGSEHLRERHKRRGRIRAGKRRFQYAVSNDASYAKFVHEGTSIVFAKTKMRRVRKPGQKKGVGTVKGGLWAAAAELGYRPGGRKIVLLGNFVSGQDAQPWLRNAGAMAYEANKRWIR